MAQDSLTPPPLPAIPVAIEYAQTDGAAVLSKLIRIIGILLLVLGAVRICIDPLVSLRPWAYRPFSGGGPSLLYMLITFFGHIAVDVLAICGGIACLRRLASWSMLLTLWSWSSLVLGAVIVALNIIGSPRYSAVTSLATYQIAYIGTALANFAAAAGLPIVCLALLRLPDARRVLGAEPLAERRT